MLCITHLVPHLRVIRRRVRLFNKGDKLSKEAKERKLKREYIALIKLDQLLFYTEMGREGANFIQEQMKNREMAESMTQLDPDMTVKSARKLIRQSVEAQRKADNSKRARFGRPNNNAYVQIINPISQHHRSTHQIPHPGRGATSSPNDKKRRPRRRPKRFNKNHNSANRANAPPASNAAGRPPKAPAKPAASL